MNENLPCGEGQVAKCGFVSVIGLPNAGKSTLINRLVGTKVSIVSRRVQTTRTRVLGIMCEGDSQVVLIDTPGVFQPHKTLEKAMVGAAWDSVEGADKIIHLVDAAYKDPARENADILKKLSNQKNVILVLNKVDKAKKPELLALAQALNDEFDYEATFMISSLKGSGVNDLREALAGGMPAGEWAFPEDQASDMPMRFFAAEITREKIFERLHQELPHATLVETESWEEFDNGDVKISQVVYVQRDSQKAIVLGKRGSQIKEIGQAARRELSNILERPVHLKLFVKVQENWPESAQFYEAIGLDYRG